MSNAVDGVKERSALKIKVTLEHSINRIAVESDGHRFPPEHVSPDGHPPEQPLPEAMLTL